jgi:hypothetical protein
LFAPQDIGAFDEQNRVRAWPPHGMSPYQVSGEPWGVDELRNEFCGQKYSSDLLENLEKAFIRYFGDYLENISFSLERSTKDPTLKENEVRLIVNWREPELPPIKGLVVTGSSLITEDMKREMLKDLQVSGFFCSSIIVYCFFISKMPLEILPSVQKNVAY